MSKGLERKSEHYSYSEVAYQVIDRNTGQQLTDEEILWEINRDRSHGWEDFTIEDLKADPKGILDFLSPDFYLITIS